MTDKITSTMNANSTMPLLNNLPVDIALITNFCGMTDKWIYRQIQYDFPTSPVKPGRSSCRLRNETEEWVV